MLRCGVAAAAIAAAAVMLSAGEAAAEVAVETVDETADEATDETPADTAEDGESEKRVLLFSGNDVWRQGSFLYGGVVVAPFGLDSDGAVIKLLTANGFYRYRSGAFDNATVIGAMGAIAVMPGVHFSRGGITMTVYAGFDYQNHRLSLEDFGNPARGRHTGARIAAELWAEPTPQTMVAGSAMLSTIGSSYAVRLAAGWRLFDLAYLGPEALVYGARNYRQWRVGAHVTGLKVKKMEFQAAVGYAQAHDHTNGVYVRINVIRKH
jgi:hypothetical protein